MPGLHCRPDIAGEIPAPAAGIPGAILASRTSTRSAVFSPGRRGAGARAGRPSGQLLIQATLRVGRSRNRGGGPAILAAGAPGSSHLRAQAAAQRGALSRRPSALADLPMGAAQQPHGLPPNGANIGIVLGGPCEYRRPGTGDGTRIADRWLPRLPRQALFGHRRRPGATQRSRRHQKCTACADAEDERRSAFAPQGETEHKGCWATCGADTFASISMAASFDP